MEFKYLPNNFQENLKREVNNIENEPNLINSADKTPNHYKMPAQTYKSLLDNTFKKNIRKLTKKP